jgi:putative integral membrane protein (TIGR02587 family)
MELWRHGATISADRLLLSMAATLGILILFNRTIGSHPDSTWKEVTMESVEELGLGMITSAVVLLLIGRVRMGMPMQEWIGKVTAEALVTSIGVSIGTVQFGAPSHARVKEGGFPILGQVAIAFCGSIFLAASIAPTEEILLIAVEQSSASALQLLIALVVASAVMLGFSDLRRRPEFRIECGIPRVIFGPIVTVGVSLVTAAFFYGFSGISRDTSLALRYG